MRITLPAGDGTRLLCRASSPAALAQALGHLQTVAQHECYAGVGSVYDSGLRYRPEPPGRDDWHSPSEALTCGALDCEDAAAWRAAELVASGADPDARVAVVRARTGRGAPQLHAVVRRGSGAFEDPCVLLGMGGAPRGLVSLRRTGRGYAGIVRAAAGPCWATGGGWDVDPARALGAAWVDAHDRIANILPADAAAWVDEAARVAGIVRVGGPLDELASVDLASLIPSPEDLVASGIDLGVEWLSDAVNWLIDGISDWIDRIANIDTYRSASYRSADAARAAQHAPYERRMAAGRDRTVRPGLRDPSQRDVDAPITTDMVAAAQSDPTLFPGLLLRLIVLRRVGLAYFHDHEDLRNRFTNELLDAGVDARAIRAMSANVQISPGLPDAWRFSTAVDLLNLPPSFRDRAAAVAQTLADKGKAWSIAVQTANDFNGVLSSGMSIPDLVAVQLALTPELAGVWGAPTRTTPPTFRRGGPTVSTLTPMLRPSASAPAPSAAPATSAAPSSTIATPSQSQSMIDSGAVVSLATDAEWSALRHAAEAIARGGKRTPFAALLRAVLR